jgi:hypothetical protein
VSSDNPPADEHTDTDTVDSRRRRLLGYAAIGALGATGVAGAWYASRETTAPESTEAESPQSSPTVDETLVRRYAPDLYFGRLEKWFPTDPRQYVNSTNRVVEGMDALEAYTAAFVETATPPHPTVFYNVVTAADGVDAIQYWMYSVFDQFTVNFHWHDWELLQVFVDSETGEPLLVSASAHSRAVPNNEYLSPDVGENRRPGVLAEVGSHSSASELNGVVPSFERIDTESWRSDVSNESVGIAPGLAARFAYGLPRDEGARLPFVMPELDGYSLHEHPSLSVDRAAFIDESVTVDAWNGLPRPPTSLPLREPGLVMAASASSTEADVTYALEPIADVREAVDDFGGPQLSFEFAIPGFIEDLFASHITSVGIPWEQPRFTDPLEDVTDSAHRLRIDGQTPVGLRNRVVGRVRQLRTGADGSLDRLDEAARDSFEAFVGVSYAEPSTEVVVRMASEQPVAATTRAGVFGLLHVDPGEHTLVVNGPGVAPVAERFVHDGGLVQAGADGELTVVATADAVWIRGDGRQTTGVDRVRVIEEYAGVVYDAHPYETDRFAVAVHREGQYTVEVVDSDGRLGVYHLGPAAFGDRSEIVLEPIETGTVSLVGALSQELTALRTLTQALAKRDGAGDGLSRQVDRAKATAGEALRAANHGDTDIVAERLSQVSTEIEQAQSTLSSDRQAGYSDGSVAGLEPRFSAAAQRATDTRDSLSR